MQTRIYMKRMKSERGQVLVLGALAMLLGALMVIFTLNVGEAIHDKIQLQQLADSAAFSNATQVARAYNFFAYTNRANVSALVSAMSLHGQMSMMTSLVDAFRAANYADWGFGLGENNVGCAITCPAFMAACAVLEIDPGFTCWDGDYYLSCCKYHGGFNAGGGGNSGERAREAAISHWKSYCTGGGDTALSVIQNIDALFGITIAALDLHMHNINFHQRAMAAAVSEIIENDEVSDELLTTYFPTLLGDKRVESTALGSLNSGEIHDDVDDYDLRSSNCATTPAECGFLSSISMNRDLNRTIPSTVANGSRWGANLLSGAIDFLLPDRFGDGDEGWDSDNSIPRPADMIEGFVNQAINNIGDDDLRDKVRSGWNTLKGFLNNILGPIDKFAENTRKFIYRRPWWMPYAFMNPTAATAFVFPAAGGGLPSNGKEMYFTFIWDHKGETMLISRNQKHEFGFPGGPDPVMHPDYGGLIGMLISAIGGIPPLVLKSHPTMTAMANTNVVAGGDMIASYDEGMACSWAPCPFFFIPACVRYWGMLKTSHPWALDNVYSHESGDPMRENFPAGCPKWPNRKVCANPTLGDIASLLNDSFGWGIDLRGMLEPVLGEVIAEFLANYVGGVAVNIMHNNLSCLGGEISLQRGGCFMVFNPNRFERGSFGQPHLYSAMNGNLLGRDSTAATPKPWELNPDGSGKVGVDMGGSVGARDVTLINTGEAAVISKAMAYYHFPDDWQEHPNFFNPYWKAKLHPIRDSREAITILNRTKFAGTYDPIINAANNLPLP